MKTLLSLCASLAWGINCVLIFYAVYNVTVALPALKRRRTPRTFAPQKRFAILVAARNEESVIGGLVESLLAQDYPRGLFDVYVLPNNCSDDTAGAARRAGARILDCPGPIRCKGDALSYAFDLLLETGCYDAFCVFDADNLADKGFLRAMNSALCGGAQAAQGRRDSKNPYDSPISGSYAVYYWMLSRFYNQPRSVWGLSAVINGCGFMVIAELLRKMGGFHTQTMTEDLEFTTQCILQDVRVRWVPEAVLYDESPLTFAPSWKQRRRWSTGLLQCGKLYGPRLLGKALRERSLTALDQFIFLLAPVMQVLSILPAALAMTLVLLTPNWTASTLLPWALRSLLRPALFFGAVTFLGAFFTTLLERRPLARMAKAIGYYGLFLLTWIPINLLCFVKKSTVWAEIKHTRQIRLAELPNAK